MSPDCSASINIADDPARLSGFHPLAFYRAWAARLNRIVCHSLLSRHR